MSDNLVADHSRRTVVISTIALVLVTMVWGSTFVVVKEAIRKVPPLEFLAIRFSIATLILAVVFPTSVKRARGQATRAGLLIGIALAAGYMTQTIGLKYTNATRSGFITGLMVIFTPLMAAVFLRRRPAAVSIVAVAISFGGLVLLTRQVGAGFNKGDALTVVTAICFAIHILLMGTFAPRFDARTLTVLQLGVAAASCLVLSVVSERLVWPTESSVWIALAITSVGASAIAFLVMTWAQQHLSPTQTAVVVTMEPVFAGVAGYLFLDERLVASGWAGAALIFIAMLMVGAHSPKSQEA